MESNQRTNTHNDEYLLNLTTSKTTHDTIRIQDTTDLSQPTARPPSLLVRANDVDDVDDVDAAAAAGDDGTDAVAVQFIEITIEKQAKHAQ